MFIYLNGLFLGLSLIMALGPQNVFLIRQGARKNHPTLSAIVCFVCDTILVCASATGLHQVLLTHPTLQIWMLYAGAVFLLYYAIKTLKSACAVKKHHTEINAIQYTRMQIILFSFGFSLLNPHAIIDSLVIIGSGSSQFPDHQMIFVLGVITASMLWFSSLTITTRYFANFLSKATVWKIIELGSGILMAFIGVKLALNGFVHS